MENETKTGNHFWKGVLVGVLATAFAGLMIVGAATGILLMGQFVLSGGQDQAVESADGSASSSLHLDFSEIQEKLSYMQEIVNYYFLFDENAEDVTNGIYKGMLSGLGDPYTVYYTPEEYKNLTETTEGSYYGIGAVVSQNVETGEVTILSVFPDSPAEKAGLMKGDILYKVNGLEAAEEDLDILVQEQIRGEEGTTVELVVIRDGEELTKSVTRGQVEVVTVSHELLPDGVTGYILVSQFDTVTPRQFKAAIEDLRAQGMARMIVDLRDNPGGTVDSAVEMLAYILPEDQWDGTIVSTADKNGKGSRYYCKDGKICYEADDGTDGGSDYPKEDGHELALPLAVLVNENSASASEIFAGTVRDYGWGRLVGTTTFGKGIVQGVLPLGDGSAIKITTAHYYTPSGFDLHGKGLEPDVEVELELPEDYDGTRELTFEDDNQLMEAVKMLEEESAG